MKKQCLVLVLTLGLLGCKTPRPLPLEAEKAAINRTLDAWHRAAAEAQWAPYFALMTPEGVFIGTDATENWQNQAFRTFSKPYFDQGKAWHFVSVQRNTYLNAKGDTAWFDELLDTPMKICRGSGVLVKTEAGWKIAQYVLSLTVPNANTAEVVKIKSQAEAEILQTLQAH